MVSLALDVPAARIGGSFAFLTGRTERGSGSEHSQSGDPRRITGRRLAREALQSLGGPSITIGRDRFGAPIWPAGFVGSLSHSGGASAVLVARQKAYSAVGLDWETVGRFDVSLWPAIFTPREIDALWRLPRPSQAGLATVLFAAKEAIQKARYAAAQAWSELARLEVTLDFPQNQFSLRDDLTLAGHFLVDGQTAVAACLIARRTGPPTTSA